MLELVQIELPKFKPKVSGPISDKLKAKEAARDKRRKELWASSPEKLAEHKAKRAKSSLAYRQKILADPIRGPIFKEHQKQKDKETFINLPDYYVKHKILAGDKNLLEIPQELIEVKRLQLLIHRKIKELA